MPAIPEAIGRALITASRKTSAPMTEATRAALVEVIEHALMNCEEHDLCEQVIADVLLAKFHITPNEAAA